MWNIVNKYLAYREGMKGAKYFEKHPHLQERLEIIEEWCEELEERIVDLEALAHPKCGIESFDGYAPLVQRIKKLEENL
jgi:DNA-binding ferritin-like protein